MAGSPWHYRLGWAVLSEGTLPLGHLQGVSGCGGQGCVRSRDCPRVSEPAAANPTLVGGSRCADVIPTTRDPSSRTLTLPRLGAVRTVSWDQFRFEPGWRAAIVGVLVGVSLLVAWIAVVPPFRGIDDRDHADAQAQSHTGSGQPRPGSRATTIRPYVLAPDDLVHAAAPECERLRYTTPAQCVGVPADGDFHKVAGGSGPYNPLYYAFIGYPSLPFQGYGALYAMRAMSSLGCMLLLFMALTCVRHLRGSPVVPLVVVAAMTPMVLYSNALAAPDGMEIMVGLSLACSLAVVGRTTGPRPSERFLSPVCRESCS